MAPAAEYLRTRKWRMPWRPSWGACASWRKARSCKYRNGCTKNGWKRRAITLKWPWPIRRLTLTRTLYNSLNQPNDTKAPPHSCNVCPPSQFVGLQSWEDVFIKQIEKTVTETQKESNTITVGWYSESDMKTVLKWPKILVYIFSKDYWTSIWPLLTSNWKTNTLTPKRGPLAEEEDWRSNGTVHAGRQAPGEAWTCIPTRPLEFQHVPQSSHLFSRRYKFWPLDSALLEALQVRRWPWVLDWSPGDGRERSGKGDEEAKERGYWGPLAQYNL